MKSKWYAVLFALVLSTGAPIVVLCSLGRVNRAFSKSALVASVAGDPTVTEVGPAYVINDRDTPITITGTGFTLEVSGTLVITLPTVYLGATSLDQVGWISTRTLTSTVPAGFAAGVYTVTVTNPDGGSGSLPEGLTVQCPAPMVQGINPDNGVYGQAIVLTITGTDFVATPSVTLGETSCPVVRYVNSATLTATVPSDLLPGVYDLTVRNPGPGNPLDVLQNAFSLYSPIPTVIAFSPDSAPNDLDTQVVIKGTDFVPTPTVRLDAVPLGHVTWVTATQLTALIPWGMDEGSYNLTVTNPGPDAPSGFLPDAFTVTQGIAVWNSGELYGGKVNQVSVSPVNPEIMYAVAIGAGLFRSVDGGQSWSFKLADTGVRDLAIEQQPPHRLYMFGTPPSLYRSDDEGTTWIPLDTDFPVKQTSGRRCWFGIRPYVHPTIGGTVYAAACGFDGGASGLIKSTNGGQDWVPAMDGLTDSQVTALAFHPTDPTTMYLGTASGSVFRSSDGGASWAFASRPVGYVNDLTVNPFGAHEVWVGSHAGLGDPCALLKSTNAELTQWTSIEPMPGHRWCGAAWIGFTPSAWGAAYSGTVFIATWWGNGYKTTDGGESWTVFQPDQSFTEDFALHPTDPDTIYMGCRWHGVHRTTDGGSTWQITNQGLTAITPRELHAVSDRPDVVYARSLETPGIFKATQGGKKWQFLVAEGAIAVHSMAVDPFTTGRVYLGAGAVVHISEDDGHTWSASSQLVPPAQYADCGLWPEVLHADPTQPGTLLASIQHSCDGYLACFGSIYRSTNYGWDWNRVPIGQEISVVTDIAYDPANPTVVYAATYGSGMLKSMDRGETWQSMGEGMTALRHVTDLAVEPVSPYRVFAETAGGEGVGLCFSNDHGSSWQQAASPLFGYGIYQILFAPVEPSLLYAATVDGPEGAGLLRSTDGARSWQRAAGVMGQIPVYSLAAVTTTDRVILYVGTTGGYVEENAAQAVTHLDAEGTLVSAGVYRYTTLRLNERVYLPVVLRASTQ